MSKNKKRPFEEIKQLINGHNFDFDPADYLDELIVLFRLPSKQRRACDWCILDLIYSVKSPESFGFFYDLLINWANWYELETAIDWLLDSEVESARRVLEDNLVGLLCHKDPDIRKAAIRGFRNLDTKEIRTFLWEMQDGCEFDTYEETQDFREAIKKFLSSKPLKRNHHIIL